MLLGKYDLALADRLVDRLEVFGREVLVVVDAAEVARIGFEVHPLADLRVVQVGVEHDDRVCENVGRVLRPDLWRLSGEVDFGERLRDPIDLLGFSRQAERLEEFAHSVADDFLSSGNR